MPRRLTSSPQPGPDPPTINRQIAIDHARQEEDLARLAGDGVAAVARGRRAQRVRRAGGAIAAGAGGVAMLSPAPACPLPPHAQRRAPQSRSRPSPPGSLNARDAAKRGHIKVGALLDAAGEGKDAGALAQERLARRDGQACGAARRGGGASTPHPTARAPHARPAAGARSAGPRAVPAQAPGPAPHPPQHRGTLAFDGGLPQGAVGQHRLLAPAGLALGAGAPRAAQQGRREQGARQGRSTCGGAGGGLGGGQLPAAAAAAAAAAAGIERPQHFLRPERRPLFARRTRDHVLGDERTQGAGNNRFGRRETQLSGARQPLDPQSAQAAIGAQGTSK